MAPEELLLRHPRSTLRWLRRRLRLSQLNLALHLDASECSVGRWESRRSCIPPRHREALAALLAPHLTTAEGAAFVRALAAAHETTGGNAGSASPRAS